MATTNDILVDAFTRINGSVHRAGFSLTREQLDARLDPGANSIGWLLWHLTRVQDDHVAGAFGVDELWSTEGWAQRFDLDVEGIGYGHTAEDVDRVTGFDARLVLDYHDAVHEQTIRCVRGLTEADLDRVVDESWDPPTTMGVRLVSVVDDCLKHVGQAAFVRGILERR
ncbi:mycothiol transferase [Georgenia sp. Z1344]|uniref:mycothiol transferase n=1 Tax=Georgenia sp. Z1344 TaxID=3416706 RepID=UPI003CEAAD20